MRTATGAMTGAAPAFAIIGPALAARPGHCCVAGPVPSVGTPGPPVDPYLFILLTVLGLVLLALGIGSFIALYLNAPSKDVGGGKR